MEVVVLLSCCCWFWCRSLIDPDRTEPDWTPSSSMFVIPGPAPLDLDLAGDMD